MQKQNLKKKLNDAQAKLHEVLKLYISKHFPELPKLAIACSGGLDSMVLLKSFCSQYSIQIFDTKFEFAEDEKTENHAREKRYQYFQKICEENNIKDLLLAHHLNDQVETVFFRFIRGTSSYGLQGIPESRSISNESLPDSGELAHSVALHRPFLSLSREDIQNYAELLSIEYREDPSNSSLDYARNRIRHVIIPEAHKINSSLLNNVQRLSKIVSDEQDFIQMHTEMALNYLGALPFDLKSFRKLHKVIQRSILSEFFTANIDFCNQFVEAIEAGGFHRINFKKGNFFTIKQKKIFLESEQDL